MKNGNALPKQVGCKKELLITVVDIDGWSLLPCEQEITTLNLLYLNGYEHLRENCLDS
jgi:hypothetical protein